MSISNDVFISYSSLDYSEARIIKEVLETNGIHCWMAPESIPIGSNYAKEIPSAIDHCRIFLLILSENAQLSKWVPLELDRAYNAGKVILPFVIKDCTLSDDFNFMLARTQRIDAFHKKTEALEALVNKINSVLHSDTANTVALTAPAAPRTPAVPKTINYTRILIGLSSVAAALVILIVTLIACGALSSKSKKSPEPSASVVPTEAAQATEAPTQPVSPIQTERPTQNVDFIDLTGVYSLTNWTADSKTQIYKNEFLEYWTDLNYLIPYKLLVKDNTDITLIDQRSNPFAKLVIDYSDMTAVFTLALEPLSYDATVVADETSVTINVYNYVPDSCLTFVYEKQPLHYFEKLLNGKSSITGKMTACTIFSNGKVVNSISRDDEYILTVNNDGTAKCVKASDQSTLFTLIYNPDVMTCVIYFNEWNADAFITIDDHQLKLYDPYEEETMTFEFDTNP